VHFLDAWTRLDPTEFARLMLAPACVMLSIALPGRRVSGFACLGLAIAALIAPDAGGEPYLSTLFTRMMWAVLWLALGAAITRVPPDPDPDSALRRGGVESGAVGFSLGLALFTLLVAALARADLDEHLSREASCALLLISLGLIHLLVRRHVLRAALAFAALGFGLDRLVRSAEAQQLPPPTADELAVWLATAIAVALVVRIARLRQAGGGAWVNRAHDLHD